MAGSLYADSCCRIADIVLQMFIAVINENFDVAEESKRSRQASHYWASHRPQQVRAGWVRKLNPYRWFKAQPKAIEVELPSNLVLPMQKALVQDYSLPKRDKSFVVSPSHFPPLSHDVDIVLFAGCLYAW